MPKEVIHPKKVFDPRKGKGAPWSQAVKAKGFLFVAGQVSIDCEGNVIGKGDIVKQTEQVFENLKAILEEVGATLDDVVSCTWYTTNIKDYFEKGASEVRRRYFKRDFPPSTLVEIKRLASPELMVELQVIVALPDNL